MSRIEQVAGVVLQVQALIDKYRMFYSNETVANIAWDAFSDAFDAEDIAGSAWPLFAKHFPQLASEV